MRELREGASEGGSAREGVALSGGNHMSRRRSVRHRHVRGRRPRRGRPPARRLPIWRQCTELIKTRYADVKAITSGQTRDLRPETVVVGSFPILPNRMLMVEIVEYGILPLTSFVIKVDVIDILPI